MTVLQDLMKLVKLVDLGAFDFALEIVGKSNGLQGKLAYNPQMFAESICQRFTSSFEVICLLSSAFCHSCLKLLLICVKAPVCQLIPMLSCLHAQMLHVMLLSCGIV